VTENNYNSIACERVTIETKRSGATINKYSYRVILSNLINISSYTNGEIMTRPV